MVTQIPLDQLIKLLFEKYPQVVRDAKNNVLGAEAYLVGMGIKYTENGVGIKDLHEAIENELRSKK